MKKTIKFLMLAFVAMLTCACLYNSNWMFFAKFNSEKDAITAFDQYVNSFKNLLAENYAKEGSLKNDDYVRYKFTLTSKGKYNVASETFTITKDDIQ